MTPPDHDPIPQPIRFQAPPGTYESTGILEDGMLGNERTKRIIKRETPQNLALVGINVNLEKEQRIVHMLIWQNNDNGKQCRNIADNYIFTIDPEENVLEIKSWQKGVGGKPQTPLSAELVTNEFQEAKLREPSHHSRTSLPIRFSIQN